MRPHAGDGGVSGEGRGRVLQVGRERLLEGRALHLVLELLVGHRGGGVHVDADGRAGAVGQRDDLDARGAGHLRACKVGHPG